MLHFRAARGMIVGMDRLALIGSVSFLVCLAGCPAAEEEPAASADEGGNESGEMNGTGDTGIDPSATSNDPSATMSATGSQTTAGESDTVEPDTGATDTGEPTGPIPCQPSEAPVIVETQSVATHAPGASTNDIGTSPAGGGGFIMEPDVGDPIECDVWAQDCPAGEKCNAWASSGGTWDATRCVTVADNPGQPGDTCTVEGNGASGLDDCDIGAMCFNVDVETNIGVCVEMCSGSPANPICETPNTSCTISNQDVLILCQPLCNPLANECPPGEACYTVGDVQVCAPDVSDGGGGPGEPCEFINTCSSGTFCAGPELVPGCQSAGCCSPYCMVGDASVCLEGQTCISAYPDGPPAECLEGVGFCGV